MASSVAAFVDTNILLYAFSRVNMNELEKVELARELVERLSRSHKLIVSAQVLSEFISVATSKGVRPLTIAEVEPVFNELRRHTVIPIDASLVQLAVQRVQQSRISYWDALIVEAALRSGASILYTEDMHHGARYDGLELRNPFLA